MSEQVPSIGRVVHFVGTNGQHYPADICAVRTLREEFDSVEVVDLFVKDSTLDRAYFARTILYNADGAPATWHWPEYVPAKATQQD